MAAVPDDIVEKLIKEIRKRKHANKLKDKTVITTNTVNNSVDDEEYRSLSKSQVNKMNRKQVYKEKNRVKKLSLNEEPPKVYLKNDIDVVHTKVECNSKTYNCEVCEKCYKSHSALNKHKAKVHKFNKDADLTMTNISKSSVDEVNTSLLNKQVKKKMKKNIAEVRVETVTVKEKSISDEPKENSDNVFNSTVHTNESQISKFFKCNICRKSFEFLSALDEHKTNCHVTNIVPYICKFCDNPFENANSLSVHKCNGTGKSSFECEICNKTYSTRSVLCNHYNIHIGIRPYVCNVCSRSFIRKDNLIRHYRIHTGEKPYACDICGKTFAASFTLTNHYKIHTDERPYACDVCSISFRQKIDLIRHYRIHTGEKPFNCGVCDMSFRIRCSRNRHVRKKHDICF